MRAAATQQARDWSAGNTEITNEDYIDLREKVFTIDPVQDYGAFWDQWSNDNGNAKSGERRLLMAALEDAIDEYRLLTQKAQLSIPKARLLKDLRNWFESNESDYIFSFAFIVETLFPGMGISRLRKAILGKEVMLSEEEGQKEEESLELISETRSV